MLENSGIKESGGSTGRKNHKGNGKRKTVDGLQSTEDWAEEEEESKRIPLKKKLKIESR